MPMLTFLAADGRDLLWVTSIATSRSGRASTASSICSPQYPKTF